MTQLDRPTSESTPPIRRGVIGVITRDDQFLVIRRSEFVVAPGKYCFPGGGIEPGETEQQALHRELNEELGLTNLQIASRLWASLTPRRVELAWWHVPWSDDKTVRINPQEVASFDWWTIDRMLDEPHLLDSNRHFLVALQSGAIRLT